MPHHSDCPCRRAGTDMGVPARRAYRTRRTYRRDTRTSYAPEPGQGRTTPGLPYQNARAGRRAGTDMGVPARRAYRTRRTYRRDTRTSYAPGGAIPGRGWGNAEQSAPAARSVAIARRASATESGSSASYTTPHTTRRPRLACTNHRRRSAQGTTVTRQSRRSLTSHLPMPVSGRRAPATRQPAPT
jgi:hypothetical protein